MLYGYGPLLLSGLGNTLTLSLSSLVLGLILSIIFAYLTHSKRPLLCHSAQLLTSLIRSIPELIVIFSVYYGLSWLMNNMLDPGLIISPFIAGVIALSLLFASYAAPIWFNAYQSIDPGFKLSGQSLGMSTWQSFFYLQSSAIIREALPALGNLWMVLLKDTALISLIGLNDLSQTATLSANATGHAFSFYLDAALLYLFLTLISNQLIVRFNKQVQIKGVTS